MSESWELACVVSVPQATGGASDVVEAKVKRGAMTATGTEGKSRNHRCASRDVMKPLDREPSNGAEPQQLLGDCATLGNIISGLWASVERSSRYKIESDLGGRVYAKERSSHLTPAVGARS